MDAPPTQADQDRDRALRSFAFTPEGESKEQQEILVVQYLDKMMGAALSDDDARSHGAHVLNLAKAMQESPVELKDFEDFRSVGLKYATTQGDFIEAFEESRRVGGPFDHIAWAHGYPLPTLEAYFRENRIADDSDYEHIALLIRKLAIHIRLQKEKADASSQRAVEARMRAEDGAQEQAAAVVEGESTNKRKK